MELNYSTASVAPAQRFAYWNDVVCRHFIPAASRVGEHDAFDARFSVQSVGDLTLAEMRSPRHFWERAPAHLRSGPNEDFMLGLMVAGHGYLTQAGRAADQQPGDLVLYDAARTFTYDLAPDSTLLLRIPRRQLLFRVPQAERLTALRLGAEQPIVALLGQMLRHAALRDLPAQPAARLSFASALLDLLATALHLQLDGGPVSAHEAAFRRAADYIDAHLDDCTLDVERIAAAQHVSARTLARVFAAQGTTPAQFLWRRRLEASHNALVEGRARQVTEAAFQHGFSDLSHFCRVFKKAYGVTPHTLLRGR